MCRHFGDCSCICETVPETGAEALIFCNKQYVMTSILYVVNLVNFDVFQLIVYGEIHETTNWRSLHIVCYGEFAGFFVSHCHDPLLYARMKTVLLREELLLVE